MEQISDRILSVIQEKQISYTELQKATGIPRSALQRYATGETTKIPLPRVELIASALGVSTKWLLGWDTEEGDGNNCVVQFAGPIAAHFDATPTEQHEYMPVPQEWLGHRKPEDFFIAEVDGNSMYPHYQHGDRILCLRCSDMGHSGRVGIMLTGNGEATLKRIEYQAGENWLDLIPLNPEYAPRRIEGADLEQCRIVGRVVKVFRDVDEI